MRIASEHQTLSHPIAAHFPKSYAIPAQSRFSTFGTATAPIQQQTVARSGRKAGPDTKLADFLQKDSGPRRKGVESRTFRETKSNYLLETFVN
jgi:hypothetical protein